MREALLIARREYLERVRSKAFLLTTLLMPLFMVITMGGSILASMNSGGGKHIIVASPDSAFATATVAELNRSGKNGLKVDLMTPAAQADLQKLIRRVDAKELDGVLWLQETPAGHAPDARYFSRSSADVFTASQLQPAISRASMRVRLKQEGLPQSTVDAAIAPVDVRTMKVKDGQSASSNSMGSFFGAYIMIFLLYFTVIYYGMNVARSVIEEKTSRIFEVLLSAMTPESLMAGKLMGVGAAGLTQIGIWIAIAVLFGSSTLAVRGGFAGGIGALGITSVQVVFFVVYFLLGFLFYSALSAAFGASVSTEQEIQQFSFIISLPLLLCLISMTYVLSNPNSPAVVACSLFPPFTPMLMYLRIAAQQPPAWQLGLSVVLMIAAIVIVLWIASRIYRVGILMYGKRATIPEMLRWLRYS